MTRCRHACAVAMSDWVTPGTMTVSLPIRASFSHMGLFAHDVQRLATFYCEVLGFQVTDRAGVTQLGQAPQDLIFLSTSADEHHQIVLAPGRPDNAPTTINQIALEVNSLMELLDAKKLLEANHIVDITAMNHGGTWSLKPTWAPMAGGAPGAAGARQPAVGCKGALANALMKEHHWGWGCG